MKLRRKISFPLNNTADFKSKLLRWALQFPEAIWLDSNGHRDEYSSFEGLLAADAAAIISQGHSGAFESLKQFRKKAGDWIFGYLSYDLKNDIESLESVRYDGLGLPELMFFQPRKIIRIDGDRAEFMYLETSASSIETDFTAIENGPAVLKEKSSGLSSGLHLKLRIFKDEYFRKVRELQDHIQRGDIYEANFCQEFYSENTQIDPLHTFVRLNERSRPPFAAFMKHQHGYLMSASPERFLKKTGTTVISQPMKGTAPRSPDRLEDSRLKERLEADPKERAENIMIVDLVRNDLSRSANKGSVTVRELCKVYSFQQVHQMISTISAEVGADKEPVDLIKDAFPMGSMTGAPKVSAMKLIEALEASRRGLYSGAIGYFDPDGGFDFNVLIRSILYNHQRNYVSFSVGSAITSAADPEKEYQECLLKARAMREVLEER